MATRVGVIEQSSEAGVVLPDLINRGLSARDRLTYYVSLLQAAQSYAQAPHYPPPTLRDEREASGISDERLDGIVGASQAISSDLIRVPGAAAIVEHILGDLRQMLQPLRAAAATRPEMRDRIEMYQRRLDQQVASAPPCPDDQLSLSAIEGMARRTQNGHDSVHQLVMDLQWELTRLNGTVAPESIDGATAYDLTPADRTLVRAFMQGVNQTRGLKFDRSGLSTSATRDTDRLSIRNDLGTSKDHAIVVHVSELTATLTYTDPHRAGVRFFRHLLLAHNVRWEEPQAAGATATLEQIVGVYTAEHDAGLGPFLTFLGSRVVFLIDWNRARKALARFVSNSEAVALLEWAANNNVGHHAFLRAGDAQLVYTALERAVPAQVRFGARLDELLGREAARLFLTSVLGIVFAGVSSGRSPQLMEDEIEAELLMHLRRTDRSVLVAAADHAHVIATLADHLSQALTRLNRGEGRDELAQISELARGLEDRADDIVRRSSRLLDQTGEEHYVRRLLAEADDIADALEETAFMLTLVPSSIDRKNMALVDGLARLVNCGAHEYFRCLEDARDLSHGPTRGEIERFLVAVDQLAVLRQQAGSAEREIRAHLVGSATDWRELYVWSTMARGLERAAHLLARCGVVVRDHVLNLTSGMTRVS